MNDETRSRAKQLRRNLTEPERRVWNLLRGRRLRSLKFRRQAPIGSFIVDFVCFEKRLVLELDGQSHDERGEYDLRRQRWVESQGFVVLRIDNDDALATDLESVAIAILRAAGVDG